VFQQTMKGDEIMKSLFAIALLSLLGGAAVADPLPLPPGYPALLGVSCGGVHVTSVITGFNDDGTIAGEVYAWTRCGGSGRGGGYKTRLYQSYHSIQWDFFGNYLLSAYDGGALDATVTAVDAYGNVAYTLSGAAQLTVNQLPPDAVTIKP
jgi:hypothetical protein